MSTSVQLGDILEVQNGFAFKSEFFTNNGGIPLIRIRDLPNASTETNYSGEYRPEFLVQPGDFLIGMDGDFRCVRWNGLEGLLNQRVCRLRNFSAKVEPDYVFHAIGRKLDDIHNTTSFATVKHLSSKQILQIEIPFPPLSEQRHIVDILNRANGIRRLRREAQEKARQVIPALFVEMFGDPLRNPKGWPTPEFGDVISDGPTNGLYKPASYFGSGVLFLDIKGLYRGHHADFSDTRRVTVSDDELQKYLLRPGDILVNRVSKKPEGVGVAVLVADTPEAAVFESNMMRLRTDHEIVAPEYLVHYLSLPVLRREIISRSRIMNQASINQGAVRSIPLLLPPLDLQHTFASRVSDIQAMIAQQDRMAAVSERLVQSLMAEVFEG